MPPKKTKTEKPSKAVWTLSNKEDFDIPDGAYGFTYRIDVIGTPFYYYGQKRLTSTRGRGKKAVTKESAWRNYEGSSLELKALIKSGKKIKKQILEFAYSKSDLTLKETKQIICNGCLEDTDCLNRWVALKVWQHQIIKRNGE